MRRLDAARCSCGMRFHSAPFLPLLGRFVQYYNGKKINSNEIVTIRMSFDKTVKIEHAHGTDADRIPEDSAKAAARG
jgi:hypothetical protein